MDPVRTAKAITVSGLLLCLGGYQLLRAWRNHVLAQRSQTWASVPGRIAGSYGQVDLRRGYLPRVSYWYTVNGMRYTGSRITFGDAWLPISGFEDLRNRYPFGTAVTVYYDPKNPQHSALEPRAVNLAWACFLGTICLLLGGLLLLLLALE